MSFCAWLRLHVFALGAGYMFFHACHWLHVLLQVLISVICSAVVTAFTGQVRDFDHFACVLCRCRKPINDGIGKLNLGDQGYTM